MYHQHKQQQCTQLAITAPNTCPQFKYVESQADAYRQCLTAELLMHLVPLLTGTIGVDTVVAILITCMAQDAQQTVPCKQKRSVRTLFQGTNA